LPLRAQLESSPETIGDLMVAAEQRYREGQALMTAGRWGAGIYLMGYSAEMYLKTACFQVTGSSLADQVRPLLRLAIAEGRATFPAVRNESCHSLLFWAHLLLRERRRAGLAPWSPMMRRQFLSHVGKLYSTWWVEMRYRPDRARPADGLNILSWTGWLRLNHPVLWR
jgi:hypothetical protein